MPVDRERLQQHVTRIAAAPRPAGSPELAAAREYVAGCLRESGWKVLPASFDAIAETGARLAGTNAATARMWTTTMAMRNQPIRRGLACVVARLSGEVAAMLTVRPVRCCEEGVT
jgi:hypothetical protein